MQNPLEQRFFTVDGQRLTSFVRVAVVPAATRIPIELASLASGSAVTAEFVASRGGRVFGTIGRRFGVRATQEGERYSEMSQNHLVHPWAARTVLYKTHAPSLHICSAKCMGGKCGGVCECRCGGANHGASSVK